MAGSKNTSHGLDLWVREMKLVGKFNLRGRRDPWRFKAGVLRPEQSDSSTP